MRGNNHNLAKSGADNHQHHIEMGREDQQQQQPKNGQQKKKSKKGSKFGMLEEDNINFSTAVWTTSNVNKLLGNNESANIEFQYLTPSTTTATTPTNNSSSSTDGNNTLRHIQRVQSQNNKNLLANNSTIKLLPDEDDDKPSKQVSEEGGCIFVLCGRRRRRTFKGNEMLERMGVVRTGSGRRQRCVCEWGRRVIDQWSGREMVMYVDSVLIEC